MIQYHIVPWYYTVSYCIMLYQMTPYYIVSYNTLLYCMVVHWLILYWHYMILFKTKLQYPIFWYKRLLTLIFIYMYYDQGGLLKVIPRLGEQSVICDYLCFYFINKNLKYTFLKLHKKYILYLNIQEFWVEGKHFFIGCLIIKGYQCSRLLNWVQWSLMIGNEKFSINFICEQEQYMASAQEYAQVTELSRRVSEWEERVLPKLEEEVSHLVIICYI